MVPAVSAPRHGSHPPGAGQKGGTPLTIKKNIRTRLVAALSAVALAAGVATVTEAADPEPAAAGVGYWSESGCSPAYTGVPEVWWWAEPDGSGTWYWRSNTGTKWVGGEFMQTYAALNYECGPLGAVEGPWYWYAEGEWRQQFEGGFIDFWHCEWWTYEYGVGWRYVRGTYCNHPVPPPYTGGRQ